VQAEQSAGTAPVGSAAELQLVHVEPMITLPAGQRHSPEELYTKPFEQMQPKALASPVD
jgi:hypothetical protein